MIDERAPVSPEARLDRARGRCSPNHTAGFRYDHQELNKRSSSRIATRVSRAVPLMRIFPFQSKCPRPRGPAQQPVGILRIVPAELIAKQIELRMKLKPIADRSLRAASG